MKGDVNILTTIHSYITSLLAQAYKHLLICFIYRFTRTLNNIFGPQIYLVHDRCFCPFICALYSKGKKKKLYEIERYEISVTVFSSFFFVISPSSSLLVIIFTIPCFIIISYRLFQQLAASNIYICNNIVSFDRVLSSTLL